eukprot:TRINITY_DN6784_c0_g1_i12.p1 TRINITY_DN6784_c0_g1~~TRINITY_DN6784_c0_g1_i12.p1  ORF type:complete len:168 (+),score=26.93 TRINITY_DN6784_c0_g1_i12:365-868(+)
MASNKLQNLMATANRNSPSTKISQIKTTKQRPVLALNTDFQALKIRLISGKDLAAKDLDGKSDPYIRLWCGPFKFLSRIVNKTLSPVWNETFEIPAIYAKSNPIDVECWDWDAVGGDDYMGEFSFSSDIVIDGEVLVSSFALHKPKVKSKRKTGDVSGSIQLELQKI